VKKKKKTKKILFAVLSLLLISVSFVAPCFAAYIPVDRVPIQEKDFTHVALQGGAPSAKVNLTDFYCFRFEKFGTIDGELRDVFMFDSPDMIVYVDFTKNPNANPISVRRVQSILCKASENRIVVTYYTDLENEIVQSREYSINDATFYSSEYITVGRGGYTLLQSPQTEYTVYRISKPFQADDMLGVSRGTMGWIARALSSVQSIFFQDGSLTFLGIVSIIAVSLGIGWLLISVAVRFFQLRG
jgi:hypothetical protein